jgi:hypothetical protein
MKFYRYDIVEYAVWDHDGEFTSPRYPNPSVELREYNLFKETPQGYWIGYGELNGIYGKAKWISKTSRKRFAYPTKEEALTNFIKRNQRRVRILKWQIDSCSIAVNIATEMLKKEQELKKCV